VVHRPQPEVVAAARQDVATLLRHLRAPARQAYIDATDRAVLAEAYLRSLGLLVQAVCATPALAAGLQVCAVAGSPQSLYEQLQGLLLAPVVQGLLPPPDEAQPAVYRGTDATGPADDVPVATAIADEIARPHRAGRVALHGVPEGYHAGQAALLGDDTGAEPAV
jgi:hypothetical protein